MSNLTFYRAPMSTASVTELVLEELGIPHETVTVDIRNGGNKKPEYLIQTERTRLHARVTASLAEQIEQDVGTIVK